MTEHVYHFTDTARLPWIVASGELRPGRNQIGSYPIDFLWATTNPVGDRTASIIHRGYYDSATARVRLTLLAEDFERWPDILQRFPQWTGDHVQRLEAAALSRRALQLTAAFPVLAIAIYSDNWRLRPPCNDPWSETATSLRADFADRKRLAAHLVDRGARRRDVAAAMNIPMALRGIKLGVAHLATYTLCLHPELLDFVPGTTLQQRIWLLVVSWAINNIDQEFGAWAARHVPKIHGRRYQEVGSLVSDLADWARPEGLSRKFITRPFSPSMSLKTVIELSTAWHNAVANNMGGPDQAFPATWFPAAVGDHQIMPIETAAELYREGHHMHHCAGTYAGHVQRGGLYIYSIHGNDERVATMAIARAIDQHGAATGQATISEIRRPCNAVPDAQVISAARRWLCKQPPLPPLPGPTKIRSEQPEDAPADIQMEFIWPGEDADATA